jgi:microcystin-dependent protein
MASGSFGVSTSNPYVSGSVTWSESNINIMNDTSDVYVEMRLSRTNSGYSTSGSGTFTINVNGTNLSNSPSFNITQNSNTLMVSGTVNVTHDANGSKSITISWSGNSNVFSVNSGSGTATLNTIPRSSTVASSVYWTAGVDNLPISLNVTSSSFHHTLEMFVQHTDGLYYGAIGSRTNIGTSTTWVFTQDEITQIYTNNNMYESRPVILRVWTYDSNNNQIGDSQDAIGTVLAVPTAYATLNSNNTFNIGDSVPYNLNNYTTGSTGGFTYDLTLTIGSFTKSWNALTAQTGTLTFTSTEITNIYNTTPNAQSISGTVTVRTKYNGVYTEDGLPASHDANFTVYVTNSNPVFSTGYSYADINSTTTAITGDASYIIQNNSTVQVTIPTTAFATAQNGSSMTANGAGYSVTLNGITMTASQGSSNIVLNFGTINATTNQTIIVTATDSRGLSTTTSMVVKIIPYKAPTITSTVARNNNFDATTILTLSGSISTLTVGVQKNALQTPSGQTAPLLYRYAENVSNPAYGAWTGFTYTTNAATYSATNATLTLDNTKSFILQVQANDKLQSSTVTLTVAAGVPIIEFEPVLNSVGVGMSPIHTGTLETAGAIYESGTSLLDKYAPAGTIQMFAGNTAPSGWLLCQGQAVSRTTYSRLFTICSTNFGAGDGSTTFNVPNLKGNVPVGLDSSQTEFNTLGKTGGEKTHTLNTTEIPSHDHQVTANGGYYAFGGTSGNPASGSGYGTQLSGLRTGATGGGGAHNNLQPYITLNYIIRT